MAGLNLPCPKFIDHAVPATKNAEYARQICRRTLVDTASK